MIASHTQSSPSRDLFRNYFNARIISGPPVYVRKQFCYIGHATTTYSAEHAASVIGHISDRTRCVHALPFAISMIEGGEVISVSEDNGEFGCGRILFTCLSKLEGYNVLVCVSRRVGGLFVTDMVQDQKHRAVQEAATKALELLRDHLTSKRSDDSSQLVSRSTVSGMNSLREDSLLSLGRFKLEVPALEPIANNKKKTLSTGAALGEAGNLLRL